MLLCAFACFTVLPALLMLFDRRSIDCRLPPHRLCHPAIRRFAGIRAFGRDAWLPGLVQRPGLVLGARAVLAVVLAVCASGVRYDHNLLHLQAQGPGLGEVGDDADRAHDGGELARAELHRTRARKPWP